VKASFPWALGFVRLRVQLYRFMDSNPVRFGLLTRGYRLLISVASRFQSLVLLALRLYWGWQFFADGKGKLLHLKSVADYFGQLHIPFPYFNASLASAVECGGGLLLLAGLGSRLVAVPLIFTMIIAYLTAEIDKVKHIFSDPDKFVTADPFLYLLASVIILVFGPGVFSLDWILAKKLGRTS
jgi:putative oxidoreductase